MSSEQPQKEYIITEGMIQIILDWLSYRRYNDCDVDTMIEMIRSRPHPAPSHIATCITCEPYRKAREDERAKWFTDRYLRE